MSSSSNNMMQAVAAVLDACQRSLAKHRKAAARMKQLHEQNAPAFTVAFVSCLRRLFTVKTKSPHVERLIKFVVQYSIETELPVSAGDGQESPFLPFMLRFCLNHSDSKDDAVRYHSCQIVARLIAALPETAEFEDEMWDLIERMMVTRTKDKVAQTRAMAVWSLSRLQDVGNPSCSVTAVFKQLLEEDPSQVVRLKVLDCIAISRNTVAHILKRTRDVKDEVRRFCYTTLTAKVDIKSLKIEQRVMLLHSGLTDRVRAVRDVCVKMLCDSWLKSCDMNPIQLLYYLNVEDNEATAVLATEELVRFMRASNLISKRNVAQAFREWVSTNASEIELKPEQALLWRYLATVFADDRNDADGQFDVLFPDVPTFNDVLRLHAENDFVLRQLLPIAAFLDIDEAGRRQMSALLCELLMSPNTPAAAVSDMALLLEKLQGSDITELTRLVLAVIDSIQTPLKQLHTDEAKQRFQAIQARLQEIMEQVHELNITKAECVQREDFKTAKRIKAQQAELAAEAKPLEMQAALLEDLEEYVIVRCLAIAENLMDPKFLYSNKNGCAARLLAELQSINDNIIGAKIAHPAPAARCAAYRFRSLMCLIPVSNQRQLLLETVPYLAKRLGDEEEVEVISTILKGLFDVILFHGRNAFPGIVEPSSPSSSSSSASSSSSSSNEAISFESLVDKMSRGLTHDDGEIRTIAVEGFAKLLFTDAVPSQSEILKQLLVLFFTPTTAEDYVLRQCLSVFFSVYTTTPQHVAALEQCFFPTLHAFIDAPVSSPLFEVKVVDVGRMMLNLLDSKVAGTGSESHDRLVVQLITAFGAADEKDLGTYSKLMLHCNLSANKPELLRQTQQSVEAMLADPLDTTTAKALRKFNEKLTTLLASAGAGGVIAAQQPQPMELDESDASEASETSAPSTPQDASQQRDDEDDELENSSQGTTDTQAQTKQPVLQETNAAARPRGRPAKSAAAKPAATRRAAAAASAKTAPTPTLADEIDGVKATPVRARGRVSLALRGAATAVADNAAATAAEPEKPKRGRPRKNPVAEGAPAAAAAVAATAPATKRPRRAVS